jgi:signal transduction histidine kinase
MLIEDTGAGIPRDEIARIFDRSSSGSGIGGRRGTGLGLTLVRAGVRGHGGEVRVRSEHGAGARFEIMLPATAPASEGRAEVPAPAQAGDPCGHRKLL